MANSSAPLVSIAVPVFNGERYLSEALDSLLAQDYPNLEIIFTDDGSTDKSADIFQSYVAKDKRCQYFRNPTNLGAAENFNRAFALSHGEFFMWAAFDDLRAPTYVRKCVEALINVPSAVMCCTGVSFIDEAGQPLDDVLYPTSHPVGVSAAERIDGFCQFTNWVDVYSLVRRSALEKTHGFPPIFGGDVVLTLEILLQGPVLYVPEKLWTVRMFQSKSGSAQAQTLVPSKSSQTIPISYTDFCASFWFTISRCNLPFGERCLLILRGLLNCAIKNRAFRAAIFSDSTRPVTRAIAKRDYVKGVRLLVIRLLGVSAYCLAALKNVFSK